MKKGKLSEYIKSLKNEDVAIRLPSWTNCVLFVRDVGAYTLWGRLIDIKENLVINQAAIYSIDEDWVPALNLKEILSAIHVRD